MLNILRHKGVAKKVLWFVTGIIVLSFGLFGMTNRLDHTVNSVGTMYGKRVSVKDFEQAYLATRDVAILLYGDRFFKAGNRLNLEQDAWDRLILLKEAKKRGITVSDQELVDYIASIPFFQREGKFDNAQYEMIVKNPSIFDRDPHNFEEGIRGQLMIKKLLTAVTGTITISDAELKKEYQTRNEKIKLDYILFTPQAYAKNITVSDDDVKKFYDERKEQFRLPPTINLTYVQLTYPAKATDADKNKIKKEIYTIAAELKPDTDLGAVAKKHNTDVKTSGFFTLEQPLLTFASSPESVEKLFAMKVNEYSKPLEVPDGWQIVQVKEKKDSYVPAWVEMKDKAKEALLMQKAFEVAKTKADEALIAISNGLKAGKNFKALAAGLNLKVEETPAFSRGEYIANMGIVGEFQQETLSLNKDNRLSTVVATSQGAAILYLENITPIDEEQFKADEANFREMLIAEKNNQLIISFITKLRVAANVQSRIKRG